MEKGLWLSISQQRPAVLGCGVIFHGFTKVKLQIPASAVLLLAERTLLFR
jgi:hypothetical protein